MNTLNSLFDWTLAAGLRASLLVLAVLTVQWCLKKRLPSRWRYAMWLPVLVALVVPALPLLPAWMNWPAASVKTEDLEKTAYSAAVSAGRTVSLAPETARTTFVQPPEVSAVHAVKRE